MDDVFTQTSQAGDIDKLFEFIRKDAAVLKRIDEIMFEDTPLHVAASAGQTCFAMEVMNLMPSFARKLNKDGLSPMHLALSKEHYELVLLLLRADQELVRVKGRGGITPLHYVTQIGNIRLLAIFLAASPRSIEDVTVKSETVFHIAVRSNMIGALKVFVGWLKRVCHKDAMSWMTNIPNWRDKNGDTALDIAVSSMQIEAIQLLAEINAKNFEGLTALGALQNQTKMDRRVIHQMLRNTRSIVQLREKAHIFLFWLQPLKENCFLLLRLPKYTSLANYLGSSTKFDETIAVNIKRLNLIWSESVRNALLVVAGFIIAATFQAAFSPPGDFRKAENHNPNTTANGGSPSKAAWNTLMNQLNIFAFLTSNTAVLCTLIYITFLLLLDSNIGVFLSFLLLNLLVSYVASTLAISVDNFTSIINGLVLYIFIMYLAITIVSYVRGSTKIELLCYNANKCPKQAAAEEVQESGIRTTSNEPGGPNNTSA